MTRKACFWSAILTAVATVASANELSCAQCTVIQEAIHRSINYNITALEKKALAGTASTATVEIGQIIWHLCGAEAWKEARHRAPYTAACKRFVKLHTDLATNYWKEKSSEEYKDGVLALRMKRAVCANPDVGACTLEELPSDYEPLRPDECAICRAVVSDLFGVVDQSRERPTEGKRSDAYYRLVGRLSSVCAELATRHAMRPEDRDSVHELCEELWDEHEGPLLKLALRRDERYAVQLCTDVIEVCDEPMARTELYAYAMHDRFDEERDEL